MALVPYSNSRPGTLQQLTVDKTREGLSWLRDYITAIKNGRYAPVGSGLAQVKVFDLDMIKVWERSHIIVPGRWHPFTQLERRAREATRNEAW